MAAHSHMNDRRPPQREQVDGHIVLKSASDAGNWRHSNLPSVQPPRNPLASKVERAPREQIPYEDIVSMMKEQVERIRELEQNIEKMRGAGERDGRNDHHQVRDRGNQY